MGWQREGSVCGADLYGFNMYSSCRVLIVEIILHRSPSHSDVSPAVVPLERPASTSDLRGEVEAVHGGAAARSAPRSVPAHAGSTVAPVDADGGLRAFLLGDTTACRHIQGASKLARVWGQISSRQIECYDTRDRDLGWTIRPLADIEAHGFVCVYGGEHLDRVAAEQRPCKTHHRAISHQGDVVDGLCVRELPSTHWGALTNSSTTPNAKFATVSFDGVRDVDVVQALSKGIPAREPITIDYPLQKAVPADFASRLRRYP